MEHTSKLIKSSLSDFLEGKRIALCVTGSVAAVESVALARNLMRHGAEVHCVMSPSAEKILHPYLLEWATGNEVITELTGQIEHVTLAGKHPNHVDLVVIAPSTANTIGKIANGIDDTPVTTLASSAIGAQIPLIIVPAMHESMYDHPAVTKNLDYLREIGVEIVAPRMEEAKAKIPSVDTISEAVFKLLSPNDLSGLRFVVTAGPTRGWMDTVRFITNPSSGKMGLEIAREIAARGGEVQVIVGPVAEPVPQWIQTTRVDTSKEMLDAVLQELKKNKVDVLVSAAAILDYVPAETEKRKRPSGESYTIELVPTEKVIERARETKRDLFIVGFKVESGVSQEELVARARVKIESGVCDLVVANDASKEGVAFGTDTNEVVIVTEDEVRDVPLTTKRQVAREVLGKVVDLLQKR
ncbi:bifunctional phosphopantothenoylcysteine decarboxylase/phosphopantothenate--cysteine ligase CoaBC [Candidatus Thorarchaeota archaeon]|nr:MAG: bifunctional phosphopantothenoylcysteine decarboxylase/phosphopantothenate--cysteine ligase CoaBC [Candidatus Thorarchaeota archaeon]